jgi:hypothetical protein
VYFVSIYEKRKMKSVEIDQEGGRERMMRGLN